MRKGFVAGAFLAAFFAGAFLAAFFTDAFAVFFADFFFAIRFSSSNVLIPVRVTLSYNVPGAPGTVDPVTETDAATV